MPDAKTENIETISVLEQQDERRSKYEVGYDEVKDKFAQQSYVIQDKFKYRWAKCEKCSNIKQEDELVNMAEKDE